MMFNWLSRWLERFSTDESGIVLNPYSIFMRDEGESGGDGDGDSGEGDDGDDGGTDGDGDDDGGSEGEGDGDGGDGDEGGEGTKPKEIDEAKVLAFLKENGIEFENLENLKNLNKNLSGVTTQHQSAKDMLKGLKAALGDDYDATLAKGMKGQSGDNGGGSDFEEPAHFKDMSSEVKSKITATYDYFFKQQAPALIEGVVAGVLQHLDEKDFSSKNPDYEENKPLIDAFAKKHGITSKSSETLALITDQLKKQSEDALNELSGNEGAPKKLGAPSPKNTHRGGDRDEVIDWGNEKSERAAFDRMKKKEAAKNKR